MSGLILEKAKNKINKYWDLVAGMNRDEQISEWYKIHSITDGHCDHLSDKDLLNSICTKWEHLISLMISDGRIASPDDIPERPETPEREGWNRSLR